MDSPMLKNRPFCGATPEIVVLDDEGNFHSEDYEKDAWSGLQYRLTHPSKDCPIATHEYEFLGVYGYDTRAEAIDAWNQRKDTEPNG